jgi:L-fuconolactonase
MILFSCSEIGRKARLWGLNNNEWSFMIVDAHQHFWDPSRFQYFWMTPAVQPLIRPFLPQHLRPLLAPAEVARTVIVQAISSAAEAQWLLELASSNEFIAGVVTWADLPNKGLAKELDKLQTHPMFKGVRHQIENEPDDAWMVREDVLSGFTELERRVIPYDLLVHTRHLRYIPLVRERCPRLKLVVDHLAKPRIAEREFDEWASQLEQVSRLPDIWCKLSGMTTEAKWDAWTPDDLRPYVQHVIGQFGLDRVIFGSDWPVCTLAGSYRQVADALRQALGPLSEGDARKLWGENACKFYKLD